MSVALYLSVVILPSRQKGLIRNQSFFAPGTVLRHGNGNQICIRMVLKSLALAPLEGDEREPENMGWVMTTGTAREQERLARAAGFGKATHYDLSPAGSWAASLPPNSSSDTRASSCLG